MRLPGLFAVALLLVVPSVSAGSESDPEIDDGRDQREAWKDILAVWFEDHPDGVKFTIKVAALQSPRPGLLYTLEWNGRHDVAIGFDGTRALRSSIDTPNGWTPEGGGLGRLDDALKEERYTPGAPAYLSGVIPRERFGFEDGSVLSRPVATTVFYDAQAGDWILGADIATSRATFVVGASGLFPILVPEWVIPTIVLMCTAGGALGGFAMARVKKTRPAKVATSVPVHTTRAQPPPGQRFQRVPPKP